MTCGNCKHCVPNEICNGDCECRAKDIEVSKEDNINFYGDKNNEPCGSFTAAN